MTRNCCCIFSKRPDAGSVLIGIELSRAGTRGGVRQLFKERITGGFRLFDFEVGFDFLVWS
jgi:hypothetical protein